MMSTYQRAQWEMRRFDADRRREDNRRDRAISAAQHEAGHALVGLLIGLTPRSITIEPDFDADGSTTWVEASESHGAFENIIARMAGSESERLFGSADEGAGSDLRHARVVAGWCPDDDDIDDIIERARGCARRILKTNFAALTSLAVALLDKRTLDLGEIEEIVAAAPLPDDAELLAEAERLLASISASHRDNDDDDDGDDDGDDGEVTIAEMLAGKGMRRLVRYDGGGVV
jgi:hypothetical protein